MSKTILVTGATDGIGRRTALDLARMGARVIVHGRSGESAEKTARAVAAESGNQNVEWIAADLASQKEVRALGDGVTGRFDRLDVLLNNAGIYMKKRIMTADGIETTFAVNHVAPFLLTHLLFDLLKRSAPSRVITVASIAHARASVDFGNLQGEKSFEPYGAYALSKLGNVLFTYELARRIEGAGVTANCLHPGVIGTKLLRAGFGIGGAGLAEGAATSVHLATAPGLESVSGEYFARSARASSSALSHDRNLQKRFWAATEKTIREPYPGI